MNSGRECRPELWTRCCRIGTLHTQRLVVQRRVHDGLTHVLNASLHIAHDLLDGCDVDALCTDLLNLGRKICVRLDVAVSCKSYVKERDLRGQRRRIAARSPFDSEALDR